MDGSLFPATWPRRRQDLIFANVEKGGESVWGSAEVLCVGLPLAISISNALDREGMDQLRMGRIYE